MIRDVAQVGCGPGRTLVWPRQVISSQYGLPAGDGYRPGRALSWAESAAPDAADLQDRPARFATAIVGSVGADSNADGASMAPAAPPGKPRCLVSEGVWCLKVYDIISGPDRWQGS